MNTYFNKLPWIVFASFFLNEVSFGKRFTSELKLESLESVSWVLPVRNLHTDGSIIAWVTTNPSAVPLFYPKLVSIFEFMDMANPKFHTLEQLAINPKLEPRQVFHPKEIKKDTLKIENTEKNNVSSLENRLRQLEAKLLHVQSKSVRRPDDKELMAFILEGNEHLTTEQRVSYLTKVISDAKQNAKDASKNVVQNNPKELPNSMSFEKPFSNKDFLSLPTPPTLEELEKEYSSQRNRLSVAKSVVRFKASVPTPQGTVRPAQASEFYLTTRNLHDLFGDLNLDRALAGEVKSVAELWASAEKGSDVNPDIALSVKSILLQAKVGKTRTDPFGEAELDDVSPDDDYFLIGIDKDDQTGVVTIWSKRIVVTPGENMVELTANDVIYHK
ncbi:hypothetical protein N9N13_07635 [Opitutales bacterium]|nr:hypothetical protein [Opitutales bacterium]